MSLKGKIVEYIEQGKFYCGLVLDDVEKRVRLVNQNGRETTLPLSRIVHVSPSSVGVSGLREEISTLLQGRMERRNALAREIHMEEIWHLASEGGEEEFDASFLAELYFSNELTSDHEAAFLRAVINDPLYFKFKAGKIQVHPQEVVDQIRHRLEKEKEQEAILDSGVKGIVALMEGNAKVEWPEKERCLEILSEYYLRDGDASESALARELVKRAGLTRPHDVYHLMVRAGVWDRHVNIGLLRYGVPVAFSDVSLASAASLKEATVGELLAESRKDYRHLELLTIDGETTKDHDDALHLERQGDQYLVGIHITDVGHYIRPGDPLFRDALERTTSIYFPDQTVPMLPRAVSEEICSLMIGRVRPALSFMVLLNADGEIAEYRIEKSIVQVKRQLTYQEADELIAEDETLRLLASLSRKLQMRRIENGALIIPIPDVNIAVDPETEEIDISLADVDTPSRTLIAEFMVLANFLGGKWVAEKGSPGLFRGQDPPIKRLADYPVKDLFLNFRQRKLLAPGHLTSDSKPHSGVGMVVYSTLTSPIRRLLDLVMQLQLSSLIEGRGALFSETECNAFASAITTRQTQVNLVRQLRHRYWLLRYVEKNRQREYDAIILGKGAKRVQVLLTDFLLEGDLPANQGVREKPGDRVRVRIGKVSPLDNLLRLDW